MTVARRVRVACRPCRPALNDCKDRRARNQEG